MHRPRESRAAFEEALSIRRRLASSEPSVHAHDLAATLYELAVLHAESDRAKDAEKCCCESQSVLEPAWHENATAHGDLMADILGARALLCEALGKSREEACTLVGLALAAAVSPDHKDALRELQRRFSVS
jgi:hypothetical protein